MEKTRQLTYMALMVALICISAYISFPLPFTPAMVSAITLVTCLTAFLLPPKQTFIVLVIYVLMGAIGLPVYVGGTGGLGKLLGPTGGFIWGWPITYTLLSWLKGSKKSFFTYSWRAIVITIPVLYAIALSYYIVVSGLSLTSTADWAAAFTVLMLPFIPGDILKAIVAAWLATKINLK